MEFELFTRYGTSMTERMPFPADQMPILLALYRVIYNIPAYVPSVRVYFDNVVTPLMGQADYAQKLRKSQISQPPAAEKDNLISQMPNRLVNMLYKFSHPSGEAQGTRQSLM